MPPAEAVIAAVVAPVDHVYVPPPVAVRVVLPPVQKLRVPPILGVGGGEGEMVTVATSQQPAALHI